MPTEKVVPEIRHSPMLFKENTRGQQQDNLHSAKVQHWADRTTARWSYAFALGLFRESCQGEGLALASAAVFVGGGAKGVGEPLATWEQPLLP